MSAKKLWWQAPMIQHSLKWLLAALFIFGLFNAVYSSLMDSTDFQEQWIKTKYLFSGSNIYDDGVYHQMASTAAAQYDLKPYDMRPRFPPSCHAMLAPFVLMTWPAAKISWLFLSLLLTLFLARDISNLFCSGKYFFALLAVMVCSIPWRDHIFYGQNAIWSLYFFILSVKFNGQKKTFLSGLALALGLAKYTLTGPLLLFFLVYKRVWKNVLIALGLHGVVTCFFSLYLHQSILYLLVTPLKWCGQNTSQGPYDFFGFWSLLNGKPAWFPYILSSLVIATLVFVLSRKNLTDEIGAFALTAMVSTTLVYHSMSDYNVLVFPAAWVLSRERWDKSLVLFCVGIFLVGYLRGHYFHLDFQPFHPFVNGDGGENTIPTFKWSFKTIYMGSYAFFWYLSIGILGFKLVRPPSGSPTSISI